MKNIIFIASVLSLALACNQNKSDGIPTPLESRIEGTWKMIAVKDNASNVTTTKPSNIAGDVQIHFIYQNTVQGNATGNTPNNSFFGDFTVAANQVISFASIEYTKTMETSWGDAFLSNIRFSNNFSFAADGKLIINTSNNLSLYFERIQ